jgi:DNA (cytosine-5)-methyltransferase 1
MKPTALSLFSGLGGLDIGVEMAGFNILGAVEINPHACRSLRINRRFARQQEKLIKLIRQHEKSKSRRQASRPHWIALRDNVNTSRYCKDTLVYDRDIASLDRKNLERLTRGRDVDLVFGGPPCQSFSMSGQRQSVYDKRGMLFVEFARIASIVQPKYILLENVKGILSSRADIWKTKCLDCNNQWMPALLAEDEAAEACPKCNSSCTKQFISAKAHKGGAMQLIENEFTRQGYRCSYSVWNSVFFGAAQRRERMLMIFSRHDMPFIASSHDTDKQEFVQNSLFHAEPPKSNPLIPLKSQPKSLREALIECNQHSQAISSPRACLWLRNVVRPHDEPVTWTLDQPAPTIGAHQAAKLAIAPNGVPDAQIRLQQWHTLGNRLGKGNQLDVAYEFLSDEALLALQTFPLDWAVSGTRMERVFQIGNAVPPLLGKAVASLIANSPCFVDGGETIELLNLANFTPLAA